MPCKLHFAGHDLIIVLLSSRLNFFLCSAHGMVKPLSPRTGGNRRYAPQEDLNPWKGPEYLKLSKLVDIWLLLKFFTQFHWLSEKHQRQRRKFSKTSTHRYCGISNHTNSSTSYSFSYLFSFSFSSWILIDLIILKPEKTHQFHAHGHYM